MFNNIPPPSPENRAVYEVKWKNFVGPGRPQMTKWRMRIARWTPKATNTHSEYVILIAFPLQRWLYERASMLRYTHTGCPIFPKFSDVQKLLQSAEKYHSKPRQGQKTKQEVGCRCH